MIVVKKKMKKSLLISILAGVLVVLIAGAIIVNTIIAGKSNNTTEDTATTQNTNLPVAREDLGEYTLNGVPYAFAPVERADMEYIQIRSESKDKNGDPYTYEYSFLKEEKLGDAFVLSYTDKDGNTETYLPPILAYDSETTYSSLYAQVQSSQYEIPMLYWLCSGIGNIRISSRIDISENAENREKELSAYGLAEADTPLVIRFNYKNSNGKNEDIVLQVGDTLTSGNGYYFRVGSIENDIVEGAYIKYRPCVYTTYEQSSLSYAFLSFADYINPILVTEGLQADNAFEPYLTTDFKQWKNQVYMHVYPDGSLEEISYDISKNAHTIITMANLITAGVDGGIDTDKGAYDFNYSILDKKELGKKLISALKLIEKTGKLSSALIVTLPAYSRIIDLTDEESDKYTYNVVKIESILGETKDIVDAGTVVSATDKIRVSYYLTKGDEPVADEEGNPVIFGGVIDLAEALVPLDAKDQLVGKEIGDVNVSFTIDYTTDNTKKSEYKIYIDEIIDIRPTSDLSKTAEKVDVGTTVSLRVYDVIDGVKSDTPRTISLDIKEEMSNTTNTNIKNAIMGKTKTRGFDTVVKSYVADLEVVQSYNCYEIEEVLGFTVREEVVSFRYTQNSDRDPYYGESIYTNTMESAIHKLYALEAGSCETVVQILGGLLENASHSEGLVGLKTVDVVITPEKMMQYGLYANTIYFELPRNILPVSDNSEDYTYLSTIGFTLYISDVDPATQTRYIASDMYDIIATIDAKGFEFLDETFLSLYARKNLVLTGVENLHNVELEFFMDELHGKYSNYVNEYKVYGYNDKVYGSITEIQKLFGEEAIEDIAEISVIRIKSDYEAHCSECAHKVSLLEQTINSLGDSDGIFLDELYNGAMTPSGADFLGSDSFKELMGTLFYIIYEDQLSEQNKANVKEENLLMRMGVDLGKEYAEKTGVYQYVYEFYRVSDRRVAVRLYQRDSSGKIIKDINGKEIVSTDFYISEFSFKKFVSKYWELINAVPVNKENAFTDYDIFG